MATALLLRELSRFIGAVGLLAYGFMPIAALGQAGRPGTIDTTRLQTEYRTATDVLILLDQIKPDPERVATYRTVLDRPLPPSDAFWFTRRDALLARMDAAESLGDVKTLVACADAIMAIFRERKDRLREMEYGMSYAGILTTAGRDKEARAIEEEVAKDPKTYAHWLWTYHNRSAFRLATQGHVEAALPHYSAAASEYWRTNSYAGMPNTASGYYRTTATMLRAQGKFVEAESNYLLALKETKRWVDNMSSVAGAARHALPSTQGYSAYLSYTSNTRACCWTWAASVTLKRWHVSPCCGRWSEWASTPRMPCAQRRPTPMCWAVKVGISRLSAWPRLQLKWHKA